MNWLDRARCEIQEKNAREATAITVNRVLTALLAVRGPGSFEKSTETTTSDTNSLCREQDEQSCRLVAGDCRLLFVRDPNGKPVSPNVPYIRKLPDGTFEGCWINRPDELITGTDEIEVVNQLYDVSVFKRDDS